VLKYALILFLLSVGSCYYYKLLADFVSCYLKAEMSKAPVRN